MIKLRVLMIMRRGRKLIYKGREHQHQTARGGSVWERLLSYSGKWLWLMMMIVIQSLYKEDKV